eukprot:1462937-Amphidinium_carterae.2
MISGHALVTCVGFGNSQHQHFALEVHFYFCFNICSDKHPEVDKLFTHLAFHFYWFFFNALLEQLGCHNKLLPVLADVTFPARTATYPSQKSLFLQKVKLAWFTYP